MAEKENTTPRRSPRNHQPLPYAKYLESRAVKVPLNPYRNRKRNRQSMQGSGESPLNPSKRQCLRSNLSATNRHSVTSNEKIQLVALQNEIVTLKQENACHEMLMLPKFHCELNDMETIWALAKDRHRRDNTFEPKTYATRFRQSLASITGKEVKHISVKIREYQEAYRNGASTTTVEDYIKKMKKDRKAHKRIYASQELVNNDLNI